MQDAAVAALTAGATAVAVGVDPIPFVIGAAGATVVYAYKPPETRAKALANTVICIFLGGVVAPWASALIADHYGAKWANQYVVAGIISVVWPWAAPVIWQKLADMIAVFTPGKK